MDWHKCFSCLYGVTQCTVQLQEGDQLIAVDHFNTTDMPPKVTQRVMGGLSWPRVLVFQTK